MKLGYSNRRSNALTLTEVLAVLVVGAVLIAVILPWLARPKIISNKLNCTNNLKEIWISFKVWEGDNGDKFPTHVPVEQGGAMEFAATGNVVSVFQVMSNELSTPRVLICPEDTSRHFATDFTSGFGNTNISYFVGLDATEDNTNSILSRVLKKPCFNKLTLDFVGVFA